jgi:hypothetical protein
MYSLHDLAKATRDEKLRAAARHQLDGRASYAARRAGNRDGAARRLPGLPVLRGRRAAQAY